MKALSIQQPWVHAILRKGKDIENRTWQSKHRGWIALHASAKPQRGEFDPRCMRDVYVDVLDKSAICGIAKLTRIVTKSRSKWFTQPARGKINYGWVLTDVKRFKKPIPCKGALQLWEVPPNVLRSIKRRVPKLDLRTK